MSNFYVDGSGGGGGVTSWQDIAVNTAGRTRTGYFADAALTLTLPADANVRQGDQIIIICDTSGTVIVQANIGQTIRCSQDVSTLGGTFTSSAIGDSLEFVYKKSTLTWIALSAPNGAWTTA